LKVESFGEEESLHFAREDGVRKMRSHVALFDFLPGRTGKIACVLSAIAGKSAHNLNVNDGALGFRQF
jgi:hypothetical protein